MSPICLTAAGNDTGWSTAGARGICIALMIAAMAGCSRNADGAATDVNILTSEACALPSGVPTRVTVNEAAANPVQFSGKFLSLEGYYCEGFEMSALFETADCQSQADTGLWLQGVSPFYQHNGKKVTVTGILDRQMHGHLNQWPAGLCVTSFAEVR